MLSVSYQGVIALARALSGEKLKEIRMSYLDLFYNVVQKYGDLDKLLLVIGDSNLTDQARHMIIDRCSKRPSTAPAGTRTLLNDNQRQVRTPSRKIAATRTITVSPSIGNRSPEQLVASSSLVIGNRTKDDTTNEQSQSKSKLESDTDLYINALDGINGMITKAETTLPDNPWIVEGVVAIRMILSVIKNDTSNSSLNATQMNIFKQRIASDSDRCVETLIR